MFSDEKTCTPDGLDGFAYYWHDIRKENKQFSKRQKEEAGDGLGCIY